MARRIFFSFYYQRDIIRVNQVRKSWEFYPSNRPGGYIDHSLWEESRKKGDEALKKLIEQGLSGASVTAVLIGAETANRRWVRYEIARSLELGMGLIGIRIHRLKNFALQTDSVGPNPFTLQTIATAISSQQRLGRYTGGIAIYDWDLENGPANLGAWVEKAARQAGRSPL